MPTVEVLAEMQWNGMYVDINELEEYGNEIKGRLEILTQEIHELCGEEFNINSTKQLGEVLFEKLKLPVVKKTKSGYSTDMDVLEKLKEEHPVIERLLEYRQLMKLNSTYVEGMKQYINPKTHRIHSFFHQTITATGRISSTEPNLQNIPTRFELGKRLRKIFKPSEGCLYIDADYSQIELRVLAHISKDKHMVQAFKNGEDIHKQAASKVFNIPLEEVTKEQRSSAKAVNFGIVYGISDFGLGEQLGISRKEAKKYIEQYLEEYSGIKKFMDKIVEKAKKEGYIQRNSKIYEGIEVSDIKISHIAVKEKKADTVTLSYETSCNTIAGTIQFDNMAELKKTKQGYKLVWQDSLIFPDLESDDKISVTTSKAERGEILDRDGKMLAGKGVATSVGIIPGKLEDRNVSIEKIAELLEIDVETINNKLTAKWVKEDSFVPIETIPKVEEIDLMKIQPEEKTLEEQDCQNKLLEIPGVMLSDVEVRTYELGEAAAHLIGYVQSVTAEDLENHPGEGYSAESVIGRSGVEKLYEKQLKGKDGCDIKILDSDGEVKEVLASIFKEDGMDIRLTIDSDLQKSLYEQFKEDPGCSVAMNPYTGEVLALVSTPSYDNNEFIRGLSSEKWTSLNEDEKKPLYNRFRQVWCPGSTFKPVVAGIGLKTGSIDPKEDFGNEGLAWQKDSSWGSYQVTTLHEYEPVIMKNAIIYSDNIYFAKAALKIGSENFMNTLNEIGFNQDMPFEIAMQESTYSNTDKIETEIQLADSGYGQGQILVNPLHLASIYTSFLNEGNMIKPYLKYKEEASGETWIENAFSKENVEEIMQGVEGVVNDPEGTGYAAHRDDILLAGKTGTAELKATKEDTSGKEIGWFSVFTADKSVDKPILLISMVENVKGIGGSGYVVKKDATVLDEYFEE